MGQVSERFPKSTLEGAINCSKANPPPTKIAGNASSEIIIRLSIPAKITAKQPKQPWNKLSLARLRVDNVLDWLKIKILLLSKTNFIQHIP